MGTIGAFLCLAIFYGVTIGILWLAEPNAPFAGNVVFLVAGTCGLVAAAGFAYLWLAVLGLRGKGPRSR